MNDKPYELKPAWINKNYFFTVSYNSQNYTTPFVAVSKNGFDWSKVAYLPKNAFVEESLLSGNNVYDISCKIINDTFYMIYDYIDENYNNFHSLNSNYFLGGNRIAISKTTNFVNWDCWNLDTNLDFKQTWAPEIICDNNNYYILLTLGNGKDTFSTDTTTGYFKSTYLLNIDSDLKNISDYNKIITLPYCNIDPFIYIENNIYYLLLKNEEEKFISIFSSNNILAFNNKIADLKYYNKDGNILSIEGASIIKVNNRYLVYCDMAGFSDRTCLFVSENLIDWTTPNILALPDTFYHFTPIYTNSTIDNVLIRLYQQFRYPDDEIEKIAFQYLNEFNIQHYNLSLFLPLPGAKYVLYTSSSVYQEITPKNWFFGGEYYNYTYTISNMNGANSLVIKVADQIINFTGLSTLVLSFFYDNYSGMIQNFYKPSLDGSIPIPQLESATLYSFEVKTNLPIKINGVLLTPHYTKALTSNQYINAYCQYLSNQSFTVAVITNFPIDDKKLSIFYKTY